MTIAELNALDQARFTQVLGAIFEHSPWVAERAWPGRPFGSVEELFSALFSLVLNSGKDEQLALVRAHPDLAGREAKAGELTQSSAGEQARLGLLALSAGEFHRIADLNRRYREKFGFPCIVALRLHARRDDVMDEMERRLANAREEELDNALEQIGHIARGRLDALIADGKTDHARA